MQILADECIRRSLVEALRAAGHDVVWVRQTMAGATDEAIVRKAHQERRILLTADKDFGEIGLREGVSLPGIVLLRFPPGAWQAAEQSVMRLLKLAAADLQGRVAVLTPSRARFRLIRPDE